MGSVAMRLISTKKQGHKMKVLKKYLLVSIFFILLAGCDTGTANKVEATIIRVVPTKGWESCVNGPNFSTTIKTDDGYVDTICTYVGEPGDKVTGWWVSGHYDAMMNGFRLKN
jgi:hypothetical protein